MEFLSKYQIKSITSKWNIARNSRNSSVPLRLEIQKRIQKKKIKKFQNEIIKFLFDEKFNFKEVETYLELRDIYSQILFRSSRLPIAFQIMSIEAKTNFLRAWLVRKQNQKPNDLMSDIYRSNQFHDLKNRKMVEIELFAREITKTLENSRDITWDQLDAEVQDYISLLINGIVTNIRYFDASNTPFYVTKRLESLLIEIANFNYFDPLYHYIEQEYGIDPVSLAKYRKG